MGAMTTTMKVVMKMMTMVLRRCPYHLECLDGSADEV